MHPQIKLNEKGKCPICGMNLIAVTKESNEDDLDGGKETLKLSNFVVPVLYCAWVERRLR